MFLLIAGVLVSVYVSAGPLVSDVPSIARMTSGDEAYFEG